MRTIAGAILSTFFLVLAGVASGAQPPIKEEHPGDVALVEEGGGFVYKQFPSQLRLYVYDGDQPGKPACVNTCILAWPPLWAHEAAMPMGDWTVFKREDGRVQWAYKGRLAYTRFHDSPSQPQGVGLEDGKWHLLEP
jgi:predicted lipoprotein with Yx(FWY)xxD motif